MPVQGERALTDILPANNWNGPGAAATAGSLEDKKLLDFGAALGTLIAVVNSSQPDTANASSNDFPSASPGTSGSRRPLGRSMIAAPALPNQDFGLQTSASAAFDAFVTSASDRVNALPSTSEADANDPRVQADTTQPVPNTQRACVEITVDELKFRTLGYEPTLGQSLSLMQGARSLLPAESPPLPLQRLSNSDSIIPRTSISDELRQSGGTHASVSTSALNQSSISAEIKVDGDVETASNRTPGLQTELNVDSRLITKPEQPTGRQTQEAAATLTARVDSDSNGAVQVAAAKSSIQSFEPASTTTRRDRAPDHGAPTVSAESANSTQSALADETAAAHAPVAVATRQTQATQPAPPARIANLKVELGDGQSAQATVRERSGAVEVKIVAGTTSVAQRIVHEVEGLRNALDSAGLRLARAEVSYQQPHGERRHDEQNPYRGRPAQAPTGTEVFAVSEVNE